MIFALVGNQNCGKTTLFNALTGSNQHVGNFPGVTVDQKMGEIRDEKGCSVVDLPGIYSLRPYTQEDWALSRTMQRYWANFAKTGNPNGPDLPLWEPFDNDRRVLRLSGQGCGMTDYNTNTALLEAEAQMIAQYQK